MAVGALVLRGVLLVPSMQAFQRDSCSDIFFPVFLLHRLLRGNLMIMMSMVLVKIWGTEDKVRRTYKRLGWVAPERSVSHEYYFLQVWDL